MIVIYVNKETLVLAMWLVLCILLGVVIGTTIYFHILGDSEGGW